MADAFIGEIRAFPYTFTPEGWLLCDGSHQNIQQYQALFSILSNTYGAYTSTQFVLPDLRGLALVGAGQASGLSLYQQGQTYGQATETLTYAQMAAHNHPFQSQTAGTTRLTSPSNAALPGVPLWTSSGTNQAYPEFVPATASPAPTPVQMAAASIAPVGGGQAHNNCQPYLVFRFCINWDGTYPMRP